MRDQLPIARHRPLLQRAKIMGQALRLVWLGSGRQDAIPHRKARYQRKRTAMSVRTHITVKHRCWPRFLLLGYDPKNSTQRDIEPDLLLADRGTLVKVKAQPGPRGMFFVARIPPRY